MMAAAITVAGAGIKRPFLVSRIKNSSQREREREWERGDPKDHEKDDNSPSLEPKFVKDKIRTEQVPAAVKEKSRAWRKKKGREREREKKKRWGTK